MHGLDIRYRSDGSIDFDFSRRRAACQRGVARQAFVRRGFRLMTTAPAMLRALVERGTNAWLSRTVRAQVAWLS